MNKIIIDKENNIEINDNIAEILIAVPKLTIEIIGRVLINEITELTTENIELTLNIHENSSLIYNRFIKHNNMNNHIIINQNNDSKAIINYSFIALDKCELTIDSIITGDNNETEINVRSVTEQKGQVKITSTADVKKLVKNNNLLENIKVLLLNNEESIIIPNLLVSSNEVAVNHAATLSNIDKNYLFYLNSKGIDNEGAIRLIKNGYLLNNLDIKNEQIEKIKNIIDGGE